MFVLKTPHTTSTFSVYGTPPGIVCDFHERLHRELCVKPRVKRVVADGTSCEHKCALRSVALNICGFELSECIDSKSAHQMACMLLRETAAYWTTTTNMFATSTLSQLGCTLQFAISPLVRWRIKSEDPKRTLRTS